MRKPVTVSEEEVTSCDLEFPWRAAADSADVLRTQGKWQEAVRTCKRRQDRRAQSPPGLLL